MNDEDWIKYCKERKSAIKKEIERLENEIVYLKNEMEFFERQIKRLRNKLKNSEEEPNGRL